MLQCTPTQHNNLKNSNSVELKSWGESPVNDGGDKEDREKLTQPSALTVLRK
jgi:hypothetical protein